MTSLASPFGIGKALANQYAGSALNSLNAIKKASSDSGVGFSYLLNTAQQESSLDAKAKASSSSATGLYQFVEQTWLRVIKAYGEKHGLTEVANQISIGKDGTARVNDASAKQEILAMRENADVCSKMAAELTNENRTKLAKRVGGKIGDTELYLAHFLGSNGACTFLEKMKQNPQANAADYLPTAAGANKSVFFDKAGNARSFKEIYTKFAQKFENNDAFSTKTMVADASSCSPQSLYTNYEAISPFSSSFSSMTSSAGVQNAYSALIMAQMDMGNMGDTLSSSSATSAYDKQNKRNAINALMTAA